MALHPDEELDPLVIDEQPAPSGAVIQQAQLQEAPDVAPLPASTPEQADPFEPSAPQSRAELDTQSAPPPRQIGGPNPRVSQAAQTPDAFTPKQVQAPRIYHRRFDDPLLEEKRRDQDSRDAARQQIQGQRAEDARVKTAIQGLKANGVEIETDPVTGQQRPKLGANGKPMYKPAVLDPWHEDENGVSEIKRDIDGNEVAVALKPKIDPVTGMKYVTSGDGTKRKDLGVDESFLLRKNMTLAGQTSSVARQQLAMLKTQEKELKKQRDDIVSSAADLDPNDQSTATVLKRKDIQLRRAEIDQQLKALTDQHSAASATSLASQTEFLKAKTALIERTRAQAGLPPLSSPQGQAEQAAQSAPPPAAVGASLDTVAADPVGFMERIREMWKNKEFVPYVGTGIEIKHMVDIGLAGKRLLDAQNAGQVGTPEDAKLVAEYLKRANRDETGWAKVASFLGQSVAFGGELGVASLAALATAPAGGAGAIAPGAATVAGKAGVKAAKLGLDALAEGAARRLLTGQLEKILGKGVLSEIGGKVAGKVAKATVLTPIASPLRITQGVIQNTMPVKISQDQAGQISVMANDERDGFVQALGKSSLDAYIENLSEFSGGVFHYLPGAKKVGALKAAILSKLHIDGKLAPFAEKLKNAASTAAKMTAWNGALEEVGEEYIGGIMKVATGLNSIGDAFPKKADILPMIASFMIPGAAANISTATANWLGQMKKGEPVADLTPDQEASILKDLSDQGLTENAITPDGDATRKQLLADERATVDGLINDPTTPPDQKTTLIQRRDEIDATLAKEGENNASGSIQADEQTLPTEGQEEAKGAKDPNATGQGLAPTETGGDVATTQNSAADLGAAFGAMGRATTDDLYDKLIAKLQKGDTTEAGVPSQLLQAAQPLFADGSIKTAQDLKSWVQAGSPKTFGAKLNPQIVADAKRLGLIYQGESLGQHAFKDEKTGGNFSIPSDQLSRAAVEQKAKAMRAEFEAGGGPGVGEATDADLEAAIEAAKAAGPAKKKTSAAKEPGAAGTSGSTAEPPAPPAARVPTFEDWEAWKAQDPARANVSRAEFNEMAASGQTEASEASSSPGTSRTATTESNESSGSPVAPASPSQHEPPSRDNQQSLPPSDVPPPVAEPEAGSNPTGQTPGKSDQPPETEKEGEQGASAQPTQSRADRYFREALDKGRNRAVLSALGAVPRPTSDALVMQAGYLEKGGEVHFFLNFNASHLDEKAAKMSDADLQTFIESSIEEEITHLAQYEAVRQDWQAAGRKVEGKPGRWSKAFELEYSSVAKAMTTDEKRIVKEVYGDKEITDTDLAAEFVRQLIQRGATGRITEATIRAKAIIERIIRLLDNLITKSAQMPPALQRAYDRTKAVLAEIEKGEQPETDKKTRSQEESRVWKLVMQARMVKSVNAEALAKGKNPNGSKLTPKDRAHSQEQIEASDAILAQYPEEAKAQEAKSKADSTKSEKKPVTSTETEKRSSTQLNVPADEAKLVTDFGQTIAEDDLYHGEEGTDSYGSDGYGREDEPHITALYGLDTQEAAAVQKAVGQFGPITAKIGPATLFENADKPYDVLKFDILGDDMHRLNAELRKLPHKSDFPDYHPHMTVAYVKKGTGKKYTGNIPGLTGRSVTFNTLKFSNAEREKTDVALAGQAVTKPAKAVTKPKGAENVSHVFANEVIHLKTWIDEEGKTQPASKLNGGETIAINVKNGARSLGLDVDNPAQHVDDMKDGRVIWQDDGGMFYVFDPKTATLRQTIEDPREETEAPGIEGMRKLLTQLRTKERAQAAQNGGVVDARLLSQIREIEADIRKSEPKADGLAGENGMTKAEQDAILARQSKEKADRRDVKPAAQKPIEAPKPAPKKASGASDATKAKAKEAFEGLFAPEPMARGRTFSTERKSAADRAAIRIDGTVYEADTTTARAFAVMTDLIDSVRTPADVKDVLRAYMRGEANASRRVQEGYTGAQPGLRNPEPHVIGQLTLPKDRRAKFMELADSLEADGVKTPEAVALFLDEISGGKARPFSQSLWDMMGATGAVERGTHDWTAVYGAIDAEAQQGENASTDEPDTNTDQPEGAGGVRTLGGRTGAGHSGASAGTGERDAKDDAGLLEGAPSGDVAPPEADGDRGETGVGAGGQGGSSNQDSPTGGRKPNRRKGAGGNRLVSDESGGSGDAGVAPGTNHRGNYELTNPEAIQGGTPKQRFARNRKAIETYQTVVSENREPTPAELDAIAAYIGWGSFGQELFKGNWFHSQAKYDWQAEDKWLRENLGQKEWEGLQRSIINAHYTAPPVVTTMWDMARKMGFQGGRVLEPSMGIGNFFALMPRDLMAKSQLTGIELDPVTAGMAGMLYPDANVRQMPYEDSKTADGFYDMVIGNWPFNENSPADRRYGKLKPPLHDFFFLKAIDQVRPGGLVMGITSAGTMDKKGMGVRLELSRKADLVGAYRFPKGTFKNYAGTEVITDLLIFRKRETTDPVTAPNWIQTQELQTKAGKPITVNEYFAKNQRNVLGELNWAHGLWAPGMTVEMPPDFEKKLAALPSKVPADGYRERKNADVTRYLTNNTGDRQGSIVHITAKDAKQPPGFYVIRGDQMAVLDDIVKYRVKDAKQTAAREAQIGALYRIRKTLGALLEAQREGSENQETVRADLRKQYGEFVKTHGSVNESDGLDIMRKVGDPFYASVASLEHNVGTKKAPNFKGGTILERSTMRTKPKTENPSIADAYVDVRNQSLDIDPKAIAAIAKVSEKAVIDELTGKGAIFRTPVGTYEPAEIYLSGNVRRKLREAKDAQQAGQSMDANIAALEKVVPKDIPYFNIEAKMGNTWTTAEDYKAFVAKLLGVKEAAKGLEVVYGPGGWTVRLDDSMRSRTEATATWGVNYRGMPFNRLLNAALNNQTLTVWGRDENGNKFVEEKETKIVNAKVEKIREEYTNWVWSEPVRRVKLEASYNEIFNAIAKPNFDGSFLSFDGMALQRGNSQFGLRKHQQDAIWRGVVTQRGIYAHEVGTGKTYTMGGIAVESRRYGVARKPLLFAHNANSATVAREINEMYPGAKILYIDNLKPETRALTMAQIATDDWDLIVVPHSLVDRFTLKPETLEELAKEEIADLEAAAIAAAEEDGIDLDVKSMNDPEGMKKVRSATAKELVKQRQKILDKIKEAALKADEGAVFFEDLGVDMLLVDESHIFKKPPIASKMQIRGLNKAGSGQSINMFFMTEYITRQNGGKGVHLFTGTPITNTLNEIFNQMRFMMSDVLKRDGVDKWDAWFNTFADSVTDAELSPAGDYEAVTRLAAFVNVAELRRMVGEFMDVVFADDMPEMKDRPTASGKTLKSPDLTPAEQAELLNDRRPNPEGRPYKRIVNEIAEMSPDQKRIRILLSERAKYFRNASKKDRRDIMIKGRPESPVIVETDAANTGLDARLFDINLKDHPNSKVARAIKNILHHYKNEEKATQVIFMERGFSDQGTKSQGRDGFGNKLPALKVPKFNVAADIVKRLIEGGMKESEIAIVDGTVSKEKRKEIADKMNTGEIRLVIGNTQTLGTGVNMQTNLRAMHHLDAPWRPGDLEQRNGRGWRQGNEWNTVLEYRYITEGIDGRRWQVLKIKDQFIRAFLKADESTRVIEGDSVSMDEGESISDIADTFGKAAGDPRLIIQAKLRKDVEKLNDRERTHSGGISQMNDQLSRMQRENAHSERIIPFMEQDAAKYAEESVKPFSIVIKGKTYDDKEKADVALEEASAYFTADEKTIGTYRGFNISGVKRYGVHKIVIHGARDYEANPSTSSLAANLRNIRPAIEKEKRDLEESRQSMIGLRENMEKPFGRADELARKKKMLDELSNDIQLYPVPAPGWLREGAPTDTEVYVDGEKRIVKGHRWSRTNWFVMLESPEGIETVPYDKITDENKLPIFEKRPFEAPVAESKNKARTPNEIGVGDTVLNRWGKEYRVTDVVTPKDADIKKLDKWKLEAEDARGVSEVFTADEVTKKSTPPDGGGLKAPEPGTKLGDAYRDLVRETGFPAVSIADLAERSGYPLDAMKQFLKDEWKQGEVVLSIGDWSIMTPKQREGVIDLNGHRYLQVRWPDVAGNKGLKAPEPGELREYDVSVTVQFPSAGDRPHPGMRITAKSKADAIKKARAQTDPGLGEGLVWFKAVEVEDEMSPSKGKAAKAKPSAETFGYTTSFSGEHVIQGEVEQHIFKTKEEAIEWADRNGKDVRGLRAPEPEPASTQPAASVPKFNEVLRSAYEGLPPKEKIIVRMKVAGASQEEIAAAAGLTLQAVDRAYQIALSKLQRAKEGLAQLRTGLDTALAEEPGKRTIGRPELANVPGGEKSRVLVNVVDEVRKMAGTPEVKADDETNDQAIQIWDKLGAKGVEKMLFDKVQSHALLNDAETIAAKRLVSNVALNAVRRKDDKAMLRAAMIIDAYRDTGTEWGRAGRQRRDEYASPAERIRQFIGEALLTPDTKRRKRLQETTDPTAKEAILKEWIKKVEELKKKLAALGFDLDNLDDDQLTALLKDRTKVREVVSTIATAKADKWDALYEYWIASILSAPSTNVANLAGNFGNAAWDFTAQRFAEAAVNLAVQDPKAAQFGEFKWLLKGFAPGLARAWDLSRQAWQSETPTFQEEIMGTPGQMKVEETRARAIPGTLGRVIRTPLRFLLAADEFSKALFGTMQVHAEAYRIATAEKLQGEALAKRIAQLATPQHEAIAAKLAAGLQPAKALVESIAKRIAARRGVDPADLVRDTGSMAWTMAREKTAAEAVAREGWKPDAWNAAIRKATDLAFQDELGPLGKNIMKARNETPGLRYFLPFIQTVANIFRTGLRKSPLGSAPLLYRVLRSGMVRMNWSGKEWTYTRTEFVQHSAEQILAWGVMFGLAALVTPPPDDDFPFITGSTPYQGTKKGARELAYRTAPPMSIRVGDEWYTYSRIEPFATQIAATVDLLKRMQDKEQGRDITATIGSAYEHLVAQLKDKTFARGISDLLNAIQDGASTVEWAGNFATSWVPNIIRASGRETDDKIREQRTWGHGTEWANQFASRMAYKALPVEGMAPPAKVDLWGRELEKDKGMSPATDWLWRIFSPVKNQNVSNIVTLDRLITNWNNQHPNEVFAPQTPSPFWSITKDGAHKTVFMTDAEYNRFLKIAGRTSLARLQAEGFDTEHPKASDIDSIAKTISRARKEARARVWQERLASRASTGPQGALQASPEQ